MRLKTKTQNSLKNATVISSIVSQILVWIDIVLGQQYAFSVWKVSELMHLNFWCHPLTVFKAHIIPVSILWSNIASNLLKYTIL